MAMFGQRLLVMLFLAMVQDQVLTAGIPTWHVKKNASWHENAVTEFLSRIHLWNQMPRLLGAAN